MKSKKKSYEFLLVVLKLVLNVMEKFQEIQGAMSSNRGTTMPFETYTRYSKIDDDEQKKRS